MRHFVKDIVKFAKAEVGPTAVEYAVLLALVVAVCIGGLTILNANLKTTYQETGNIVGGDD